MGAKRPDGKAARTERVTFTRPAAERIGRVVRIVEAGDRGSEGLTFTPRVSSGGVRFRICTYTATATWTKGLSKVVSFKYQTTTPNTVTATNLFADVSTSSGGVNCAIAKEGTAWFLIAAECLTQAPDPP